MKPFNFLESLTTQNYTNLSHITVKTLKKYMNLASQRIEKTIKAALPQRFALAIAEWSQNSTPCVTIMSSFMVDNEKKCMLLSFARPIDGTDFTPQAHFELPAEVFRMYEKTFQIVVAISAAVVSTSVQRSVIRTITDWLTS